MNATLFTWPIICYTASQHYLFFVPLLALPITGICYTASIYLFFVPLLGLPIIGYTASLTYYLVFVLLLTLPVICYTAIQHYPLFVKQLALPIIRYTQCQHCLSSNRCYKLLIAGFQKVCFLKKKKDFFKTRARV